VQWYADALRKYVKRLALGEKQPWLSALHGVFDGLFPGVREALREGRCPFCGKVFRSRAALYTHIMSSRDCSQSLGTLIWFAVKVYKEYVADSSKLRGKVVVFRTPRGVIEASFTRAYDAGLYYARTRYGVIKR